MSIVCSGPAEVNAYRLLALRGALRLECAGMRGRGPRSAYAVVKEEFGLKGNKQRVLEQYTKILQEQGLIKGG